MRNAFVLLVLILVACSKSSKVQEQPQLSESITSLTSAKSMLKIDSGTYESFIGQDSGKIVKVQSFYLDDSPVTNGEFLEFLTQNPQWTKSKISRLYADDTYLQNWPGDFEPPHDVSLNAPVTNVSWFAASAYAKSVGKRLPTVDEWEFVALADEFQKDASKEAEFTAYILNAYQRKKRFQAEVKSENPNYYGVYDLFGMVWEWTEDFNSVMMTGNSRNDQSENDNLFCASAAVTTSDLQNYAAFIRYAMRGSLKANYTVNNLGFRCAKDIN